MLRPEPPPVGSEAMRALVIASVEVIEAQSERDRGVLLATALCTAWTSSTAQSQ